MRSSPFLTHDVVARAIHLLRPTIADLLENAQIKRGTMHVVVANPHLDRSGPRLEDIDTWIADGGILHEETVTLDGTEPDEKRDDFVKFARLKAHQTWAIGLPTGDVAARLPHLLRESDTIYGGSATYAGLTAAVSGQPAVMDEALAGMLLHLVVGLCRRVAPGCMTMYEDSGVVG